MTIPIRPLGALVLVAALAGGCATLTASQYAASRGAYLVKVMDCSGCHTPGALAGKPDYSRALAGSDIGFRVPGVGVVYAPNLTPHPDAGLGRWSEKQIVRALIHGERPDGRRLAPVMPWASYSALTDGDAAAIATFLKSMPPMPHRAPPLTPEGRTPPAPYLDLVTPR